VVSVCCGYVGAPVLPVMGGATLLMHGYSGSLLHSAEGKRHSKPLPCATLPSVNLMNYRATLAEEHPRDLALCKKSEHASAWGVSMNAQQERSKLSFPLARRSPNP